MLKWKASFQNMSATKNCCFYINTPANQDKAKKAQSWNTFPENQISACVHQRNRDCRVDHMEYTNSHFTVRPRCLHVEQVHLSFQPVPYGCSADLHLSHHWLACRCEDWKIQGHGNNTVSFRD